MTLLRFLQLFLDINFYRSDEYWQGPEIAHKFHYGFGFLSWEWTIDDPIRNPLFQFYLQLGYAICDNLKCSDYFKEITPKIMMFLLNVPLNWFMIKIAKYYSKNITPGFCFILMTNFYLFGTTNRFLINSVETILTTIAFYFWLTRR